MTRVEYDKVIVALKAGAHRVYVIWSAHWGRYRVELWLDGDHITKEDYETQSRRAAMAKADQLYEGLPV